MNYNEIFFKISNISAKNIPCQKNSNLCVCRKFYRIIFFEKKIYSKEKIRVLIFKKMKFISKYFLNNYSKK